MAPKMPADPPFPAPFPLCGLVGELIAMKETVQKSSLTYLNNIIKGVIQDNNSSASSARRHIPPSWSPRGFRGFFFQEPPPVLYVCPRSREQKLPLTVLFVHKRYIIRIFVPPLLQKYVRKSTCQRHLIKNVYKNRNCKGP